MSCDFCINQVLKCPFYFSRFADSDTCCIGGRYLICEDSASASLLPTFFPLLPTDYGTQANREKPIDYFSHSAQYPDCRMGILRRCQHQKPSSPTGCYGEVGVQESRIYNDYRHNCRDGHKYNNAEVCEFTLTCCSYSVLAHVHSCFMQAAKNALTQHIAARGSISLAHLSIGVAMARASPWHSIKLGEFKHIRPFLGTTVIAIVFSLVNSAYAQAQVFVATSDADQALDRWTTFLTPVQVHVPVTMNGGELDLGNQAFDTVLGRDINNTFFFSPGGLSATMPSNWSLSFTDEVSDMQYLARFILFTPFSWLYGWYDGRNCICIWTARHLRFQQCRLQHIHWYVL